MPSVRHLSLPAAPLKQQLEHRCSWNDARSADEADFFTIGYAGRSLDDIITALLQRGVRTLVDVRQNPVSMFRPEVSKKNLARAIESSGMIYTHLPEFGVPRDIRAKAIGAGDRHVIWAWYDEHVVTSLHNLHYFLNGFEHPVAFMCTEIDPGECHRHRISLALERRGLKSYDL
ncbi:MAG: DUF488 domain-containing protein [Bryobacteraceae bacterium]|nr:DUF488 domain-containing protein [Bryobacteraceae bacterium]